jgi:hypothetical protein
MALTDASSVSLSSMKFPGWVDGRVDELGEVGWVVGWLVVVGGLLGSECGVQLQMVVERAGILNQLQRKTDLNHETHLDVPVQDPLRVALRQRAQHGAHEGGHLLGW